MFQADPRHWPNPGLRRRLALTVARARLNKGHVWRAKIGAYDDRGCLQTAHYHVSDLGSRYAG